MTVVKRVCLKEHTITDSEGTSFTLHCGQEYTTSEKPRDDGTVMVFSRYWVRVPVRVFSAGFAELDEPPSSPARVQSDAPAQGSGFATQTSSSDLLRTIPDYEDGRPLPIPPTKQDA